MTDVLISEQVTANVPTPKRAPATPARQRINPAADHWSQRVSDTLGAALKRLNGKQKSLEVAASPAIKVQPNPVSAPEPDETETARSILPHPAVAHGSDGEKTMCGTDRRRFPRRQSECTVTLVERHQVAELTPRETDWLLRSSRDAGRLLDLSQTGLCLQLAHAISVGSEVLLRISNDQLNRHVDSAATVVHCQMIAPLQYSVHCKVLFDFTLDQLQDLGRPLLPSHVLA